jgi:small subunit ribosomal protein S6
MPIYETVFIARQDLNTQQVEALTKSFCDILTKNKGKILKTEQWGLRTLAYKINKARKGHYVLIECDSPAPALHEMERNMRLNEDVVRFLTVRLEEPTKTQSAILNKHVEESNDDQRFDMEAA